MLTMLATTPLVEGSALHATMTLTSAATTGQKKTGAKPGSGAGAGAGARKAAAPGANKPITFANKIKSSGYASASAPKKMFTPTTTFGKNATGGKKGSGTAKLPAAPMEEQLYPTECM
jgi:hypothetical protein